MFSSRTPSDLAPNRLARALARLRAAGAPVVDLTVSNPTAVGLAFDDGVLAPLASGAALVYEPEPFGLPSARRAVAADYARRGLDVLPERLVLTASTSEAYAHLFKLLCEPGDDVLVPAPSYPLFEHLARLDAVRAVPYPLDADGGWAVHADQVAASITPRTRAIVVVSPNNPTGTYLTRRELDGLAALAAERGLALVGDEVFFDYPLVPRNRDALHESRSAAPGSQGATTENIGHIRRRSNAASRDAPPGDYVTHHGSGGLDAPADRVSILEAEGALVFALGGLSKSAALPQVKLGWIAARGPDALVADALARLEVVADTYLSVATPVQHAAPALVEAGRARRALVQARIEENLAALRRVAAAHPACRVPRVEGGWSAVVQVPATRSEEELVVALLEEDRVLVHPGYFFDFPREAFIVVSLLAPPDVFAEAVARLLARAEG